MATDNNKKRARRAGLTLNRYRDCLGASGPHEADRIRDLLQDILHWMAHQKPPNDYPGGDVRCWTVGKKHLRKIQLDLVNRLIAEAELRRRLPVKGNLE
jgi:hypothetical protein